MTKSKIKRVYWERQYVAEWYIEKWLTSMNFQPGKFHLIPSTSIHHHGEILVVYVVEEKEIKDATQ
jgi:hypothetical protein